MNRYGIMGLLLWVFFPLVASAQIPDSIAGPLTALARRVEHSVRHCHRKRWPCTSTTPAIIRATTSGSSATWWPPD